MTKKRQAIRQTSIFRPVTELLDKEVTTGN